MTVRRQDQPVADVPAQEIEFYDDDNGHEPALEFMRSLSPLKRRAIGVALREVLRVPRARVAEGNFGKNLGEGLFEFRLDQDAEQILRRKGKEARPEPDEGKILLRCSSTRTEASSCSSYPATTRANAPASHTSRSKSRRPSRTSSTGKSVRKRDRPRSGRSDRRDLDVWSLDHKIYRERRPMGTKFSTFLKEIEDEARAEGPEAVEQLRPSAPTFAWVASWPRRDVRSTSRRRRSPSAPRWIR